MSVLNVNFVCKMILIQILNHFKRYQFKKPVLIDDFYIPNWFQD